jgi:hypothetical protein
MGLIGSVLFLLIHAYKALDFWGNMDFLRENLPAVYAFLGMALSDRSLRPAGRVVIAQNSRQATN